MPQNDHIFITGKPLVKFVNGSVVTYDYYKYTVDHVLISRRGIFLRLYEYDGLVNVEDPKLKY